LKWSALRKGFDKKDTMAHSKVKTNRKSIPKDREMKKKVWAVPRLTGCLEGESGTASPGKSIRGRQRGTGADDLQR